MKTETFERLIGQTRLHRNSKAEIIKLNRNKKAFIDEDKKSIELAKAIFAENNMFRFRKPGSATDYILHKLINDKKLLEEMKDRGTSIISLFSLLSMYRNLPKYCVVSKKGWPMGKFVQTVLSGAAQLEREMIVERVKNKIATSKEQGLWMGGTLPLGYDVKDKELIINEKEAKTVQHIFERYLELKSMAELARELNREGYRTKAKTDIFKKATVRRIITNPIYVGKIRHYDKQYEGKHEAIIEEEKWKKAQELISNQPYRGVKYEEALLKGIIKCKSCDVNMTLTYSKKENKRYRYYVCNNHLRGKGCESGSRNVIAGEVEKEVMKRAEDLYEKWEEKAEEWSFGKQKEVVKKLIKGVMVKEDGIEVRLEGKVEFVPIKKKGNKCRIIMHPFV